MNNPENHQPRAERSPELEADAKAHLERLQAAHEKRGENSPESAAERAESARKETEAILSRETDDSETASKHVSDTVVRKVAAADKQASYRETMRRVRQEMSSPSRVFSQFIHSPFVERSSEVLGSSLARPNAILAGSLCSLILVSITYTVSRTFGYQLSGFESIGAFVIGWLIGIVFDYVTVMLSGKR